MTAEARIQIVMPPWYAKAASPFTVSMHATHTTTTAQGVQRGSRVGVMPRTKREATRAPRSSPSIRVSVRR